MSAADGTAVKPAKKGNRRLIGLVAAGGVLLALIVAAGWYFFGPSSTVLDAGAAQKGVEDILTKSFGVDKSKLTDVSCPSGKKVSEGNSFDCTVKIDGQEKKVKITIINDDADYTVGRPQ